MKLCKSALLANLLFSTVLAAQQPTHMAPVAQGVTSAQAANAPTLTLEQAEAIALKSNPQISVGRLRALIAREFVIEQRSALLPNATINLTAVDSNPGSRVAAGGLNNPVIFPRAAGGFRPDEGPQAVAAGGQARSAGHRPSWQPDG